MKRVLVLMSVYNGAKFIKQQIDSILSQKDVEVNLLIRDDCSKDNSLELLQGYSQEKLEFVSGENLGFAESFSSLLKMALEKPQYDYYAFADQDDVWLSNKLISAISKLSEVESKELPCGYCSNSTLVDSELNYMRLMHNDKVILSKERALLQNIATGCTMVFNYAAVNYYVNYRPSTIKVHDYLMYLICIYMGRFIYDPDSYIKYRQHANNQIGSKSWFSRIKRRFSKFGQSDGYFVTQNKDFLEAYKSLLSVEDILKISFLCNYKKNFSSKLSLLFNRKYKYNNLEFNFFLCLKILFGKL